MDKRKVVRGYADKGKVARLLAKGWEIESTQPIQLKGTTLKQSIYHLILRDKPQEG